MAKIEKVCIVCGGKSPNPFGECFCSCETGYFQDKKIYNLIKKLRCKVFPLKDKPMSLKMFERMIAK